MKKILLTALVAVAALTANAQVYVGGTLGFNSQNKLIDQLGGGDKSGTSFEIMPEIGYKLDDKMSLGIVIGFSTTNNTNMISEADKTAFGGGVPANIKLDKSFNKFTVAPYFRYTFATWDRVSLFADAKLGFDYAKHDDDKITTFGIFITPGVAVNFNKVSFVAKLGDGLGFASEKSDFKGANTVTRTTFGLNLKSLAGLQFGAYYNF